MNKIKIKTLLQSKILLFSVVLIVFSSCKSATYWEQQFITGQEDSVLQNLASEYYTVADAYADAEKYSKAIEYYKKAMRNKEVFPAAYYKLGRTYALSSDWENAYIIYKELVKKDPANISLALSLAYITAKKGEIEESCAQYEKIIAENDYVSSALKNYIYTLLICKKNDDAVKWFEVYKTKYPEEDSIEIIEGKINQALGKEDKSEEADKSEEDKQEEEVPTDENTIPAKSDT